MIINIIFKYKYYNIVLIFEFSKFEINIYIIYIKNFYSMIKYVIY